MSVENENVEEMGEEFLKSRDRPVRDLEEEQSEIWKKIGYYHGREQD